MLQAPVGALTFEMYGFQALNHQSARRLESVYLGWTFIPPPIDDPGKTQGQSTRMPVAALDEIKSDFQPRKWSP